MHILVTGAAGKVGQALIRKVLTDPALNGARVRALCHNRILDEQERLSVVRGSIAERETCRTALKDITHVVHLATCKDVPETVIDVTIKGLFWMLEEFRVSPTARRFVLVGGDASVGHMFQPHDGPVTEDTAHKPYPGCYALSKVLEEVMLHQFGIQYGIDWCCLRAPWIMDKDDFRAALAWGDEQFGGPAWAALISAAEAETAAASGAIPVIEAEDGSPVSRNFVHVDDLVDAIVKALTAPAARQRLYNIAMDEPVNYATLGAYLAKTRGLPSKPVRGPFHSNRLDNSRAKAELGWQPAYDLERLVESSWSYQRAADDPRRVWYPG